MKKKPVKKLPSLEESHPIAVAVAPLKQASVDAAVKHAKAYLAQIKTEVKAQPNMRLLAPYPSSDLAGYARDRALARRRNIYALTSHDSSKPRGYLTSSPEWRVWNPKAAKEYIERTVRDAEFNYIVYVNKLISKAQRDGGAVKSASITSEDGVWTESVLEVKLTSGAIQRWKTKMIWNTSVHGKVFAQYPTRLMKD